MQFLKILFWFLLAFVAALFTSTNWNNVQINLWSGLIADVNLPLLLLVTFLLGFLPTYLYLGTVRWRLRQRVAAAERMLADARALPPVPTSALPIAAAGEPIAADEAAAVEGRLL
ncbi:lipopolysaccharide assembly protein LapA domain-containing protein [Sphingomonas sp. XXL09]|uniref:lipopolysaccharide assembly protein LapA domain-containing protein n=1 Tax=Sphingomonas sp. XXL09 TaxID=3457787 RepID=UPI00406BA51A